MWADSLASDIGAMFRRLEGCPAIGELHAVYVLPASRFEAMAAREATDPAFAERCRASRRESQRKRRARDTEKVKAQAKAAYQRWKAKRAAGRRQ